MLTSIGSRSSSSTQVVQGVLRHAAMDGDPKVHPMASEIRSPTASSGGRPPPPTRSRAATGTTTGGRGSTTRASGAPSRAATPCDHYHRYPRTSPCWPSSASASYRFSHRVEPDRARGGRVLLAALDHYRRVVRRLPRARHHADRDLPPLHHAPLGGRPRRMGGARHRRLASPASAPGPPSTWATSSAGPARSTSPTSWPCSATWPAPSLRAARRRPAAGGQRRVHRRPPQGGRGHQGAAPATSPSASPWP